MSTKCSKCNKEFDRGKLVFSDKNKPSWVCEDCLGFKVKGHNDWVPQRIKDERQKFKRDLIQPYREGEFSKEFKEAYPKQTAGMVKDGAITKDQAGNAKEVWK